MNKRLFSTKILFTNIVSVEIISSGNIKILLFLLCLLFSFQSKSYSQASKEGERKIAPGNLKVTHSNSDAKFSYENDLENTSESVNDFSIRQEKLLVSIGKIRNERSSSSLKLKIEKAVADFKTIDATFPFSDFVKEYSQEKFKTWYREDNPQNERITSRLKELLNELNKQ